MLASDYAHECRSADGLYEMSDEQLFAAGEEPRTAIPYSTLKDTVLSERKGYCLSRGQHFQFEAPESAAARWQALGIEKVELSWKEYPRDLLDGLVTRDRIVAFVPSDEYP